jgi:SAM-dependent methyltransferase
VPPAENIFRVAGHGAQTDLFLLNGASWYVKLVDLYEKFSGRRFETCGPVLDFGIGCGRIARFFPQTAPKLHGVDIDAHNVAWCRENLPWVDTSHTAASPPLPFEADKFELIFGHSVMTYIAEAGQHAWLGELARITRPGGLCLLTIFNELSWFVRFFPDDRSDEQLESFIRNGIIDDGALDVGVDAENPGSYHNISHTSAYIRRVWSTYFKVVTIIHGFADLQSLVVLRKKTADGQA